MQSNSFVANLSKGVQRRISTALNRDHKKAGLNWFKIKLLKHYSKGQLRHHELRGKKLVYNSPQDFLHGLKEIFIEEVYNIDLPPHAYVLDCGANIGLSVIYIKEKFPDANIIAFEPDENNYALLQQNVQAFGLRNVQLEEKAVWVATTELLFESEGNMGSRIGTGESGGKKTKAVRLKDYINKPVHFLKIDIEGAEYEVIKDIADQLHMVNQMFVEYHGKFSQNNELLEMLQLISKAGFSFYIKEAASVYDHPFKFRAMQPQRQYDVQLNIFCVRE
jgi:FkbM family methyltransferase